MFIGCKKMAILCWYLWSWWWPRTVTLCGKFLQRKREGDDIFGVGDKTSWKHPGAQIWVISGHIWGWGQNILKTSCPDMGHLRPSLRRKLANMWIFCSIGIIKVPKLTLLPGAFYKSQPSRDLFICLTSSIFLWSFIGRSSPKRWPLFLGPEIMCVNNTNYELFEGIAQKRDLLLW